MLTCIGRSPSQSWCKISRQAKYDKSLPGWLNLHHHRKGYPLRNLERRPCRVTLSRKASVSCRHAWARVIEEDQTWRPQSKWTQHNINHHWVGSTGYTARPVITVEEGWNHHDCLTSRRFFFCWILLRSSVTNENRFEGTQSPTTWSLKPNPTSQRALLEVEGCPPILNHLRSLLGSGRLIASGSRLKRCKAPHCDKETYRLWEHLFKFVVLQYLELIRQAKRLTSFPSLLAVHYLRTASHYILGTYIISMCISNRMRR